MLEFFGITSLAISLFTKIKSEASDWCLAGAKHLESLIRRE
ncbi:hypothetical protein HU200_011699 [Digitaria exilis]|uniref:Uncharacterized protein n=1 Tax=Digitaria exilis TaxID=1010633 RepID=A0A835KNQ9_9POAL|nr:hypothetical protein HU200_011699 [Digitaria exilis]